MKERIWKNFIMYLPAVCLMIAIFWFSSQPGEESSAESSRIVHSLLHVLEIVRGKAFSAEEAAFWAEKIHTPVRKLAHMTEYAVLSWSLVFPAVLQKGEALYEQPADMRQKRVWRKTVWAQLVFHSMAVVLGYAATDEFHQLFVEGRSGKVTDVLIDGCGALCGILVFLFFWNFLETWRFRRRKLKQKIMS